MRANLLAVGAGRERGGRVCGTAPTPRTPMATKLRTFDAHETERLRALEGVPLASFRSRTGAGGDAPQRRGPAERA